MAINPDTNQIETLKELAGELYRPDGSKVPKHWTVLQVGERVEVKGYTFRIAHFGESHVLLEPVSPESIADELKAKLEGHARMGKPGDG